MSASSFQPNAEQKKALLSAPENNVLLSAGAGSGKTATLSEIVYELVQGGMARPDQILVLTFTNAAANEMKERIIRKFRDYGMPQETVDRLYSAHIQTFDAFSLYLTKRYSPLLGIGSNVSVADGDVLEVKRNELLDGILEEEAEKDPKKMADVLSHFDTRLDGNTKSLILSLESKLSLLPSFERERLLTLARQGQYDPAFLLSARKEYVGSIRRILLYHLMKAYVAARPYTVDQWSEFCKEPGGLSSQSDSAWLEDFASWHFEKAIVADHVKTTLSLFQGKDDPDGLHLVEDLWAKINDPAFSNGRLNGSTGIKNPQEKEVYRILHALYQNPVTNPKAPLVPYLSGLDPDLERQTEVILSKKEDALYLLSLAERLESGMSDYQRMTNRYSFQEIDNMALRLLTEEKYASARKEIVDTFRYVLIDEYQDTNDAQDAFLEALGKKAHIFAVGDAKQSIYAFRNAKVELFEKRKSRYAKETGVSVSISMHNNYRSVPKLLQDINGLFNHYLTTWHGGIDYKQEEEQLTYDSSSDHDYYRKAYLSPDGAYGIRHLCTPALSPFFEDESTEEMKAIASDIARKVKEGYPILSYDRALKHNAPRPCRYSDFAILVRRTAPFGRFVDLLDAYGIPVNCSEKEALFESDPVHLLHALLSLIAYRRGRKDINWRHYYLSVARSYLYFGNGEDDYDDEMLYERLKPDEKGNVDPARLNGDRIFADIDRFIQSHENASFATLFLDLLTDFHLFSRMGNTEAISDSIDKIDSFYAVLKDQKEMGIGLDRFLALYHDFGKYDVEKESESLIETSDAVSLMTIHKSKGLEFPIVYLPSHGNDNRKQGSRSPSFYLSREYGLLFPDYVKNPDYPSNYEIVLNQQKEENPDKENSEQARIFYVAFTRAKETVYLVGKDNKAPENLFDLLERNLVLPGFSPEASSLLVKDGLLSPEKSQAVEEAKQKLLEAYSKQPLPFEARLDEAERKTSPSLLQEADFGPLLNSLYEEKVLVPAKEGNESALSEAEISLLLPMFQKVLEEDGLFFRFYALTFFQDPESRSLEELFKDPRNRQKKREYGLLSPENLKTHYEGIRADLGRAVETGELSEIPNTDFSLPKTNPLPRLAERILEPLYETLYPGKTEILEERYAYFDRKEKTFVFLPEEKKDLLPPPEQSVRTLDAALFSDEEKEIRFPVQGKKGRASKGTEAEVSEERLRALEEGTRLHEMLEMLDLKNPDLSLLPDGKEKEVIRRVLSLPFFQGLGEAEIYHEYPFYDEKRGSRGSIDLLLLTPGLARIVDYKTKDTADAAYHRQLEIYKENVETLFPGRKVETYLLSLYEAQLIQVVTKPEDAEPTAEGEEDEE